MNQPRIVLVNTTHPGNIGAAARAMKNMGLERLALVSPSRYPSAEATARASGADDVLARAQCFETLEAAVADATLVIGVSARCRSLPLPTLDPRACATLVMKQPDSGAVCLLFGRESSGLTNVELDRCHYLVRIPSNPEFPSLNIAAAVQIMAYELRLASGAASQPQEPDHAYATAAQLEEFYRHLEQTLIEIDFLDPEAPRQLMRRLRRLFGRARPDQNEINILRGILSAAARKPG
ncbi:MAG: RNA methyltransferase [Gammaproteobacteria bacterium]|jgi:TrmH family RNA methyltransferase